MSLALEGLDVEVTEARGLLAADKGGTSDPFCVTRLVDVDGKEIPKETFRTKTWKKVTQGPPCAQRVEAGICIWHSCRD